MVDSEGMTHVQDSLNIHGGDESFPLLVKLVETLLVPVTHTTHHNSKNNNDNDNNDNGHRAVGRRWWRRRRRIVGT